jgi:hypothetical protein
MRIAGQVIGNHSFVAGEICSDPEFGGAPINIRDRVARWRLDEKPEPYARRKDELGRRRLISPGAGREGPEHAPIAPVLANRQGIEPHRFETVAQIAKRIQKRPHLTRLRKGVVIHFEKACWRSFPTRNMAPLQIFFKPLLFKGPTIVDAILLIDPCDQFVDNAVPIVEHELQGFHIDRYAVVLHQGDCRAGVLAPN